MATRGTYNIDGMICYNHHDNYPLGAAFHFLVTIRKTGSIDLFSMIRGMERLEKGQSVFDGPAEYHYKIDSKTGILTAYKILDDKDELVEFFKGPIEDFINDEMMKAKIRYEQRNEPFFEEGETMEDYTVFKEYKNRYATASMIRVKAEERWAYGVHALEKGWIGNSSGAFQDSLKLFALVGNYEEKKTEWLNVLSPLFAEKYNHETTKHFDSYIIETITEVV
jgi:hypothetical protein